MLLTLLFQGNDMKNSQYTSPPAPRSGIPMPLMFAGIALGSLLLTQIGALTPIWGLIGLSTGVVGLSVELGEKYNLITKLKNLFFKEKILSLGVGLVGLGLVTGSPLTLILGAPLIYTRYHHPRTTSTVERGLSFIGTQLSNTLNDDEMTPAARALQLAITLPNHPSQAISHFISSQNNSLSNYASYIPATAMTYFLPSLTSNISLGLASYAGAIVPIPGVETAIYFGLQGAITYSAFNATQRLSLNTINMFDNLKKRVIFGASKALKMLVSKDSTDIENKANASHIEHSAQDKIENSVNETSKVSANKPCITPRLEYTPNFHRNNVSNRFQNGLSGCNSAELSDVIMSFINPFRRKRNF